MNITVTVIDGASGLPAEGVEVILIGRLDAERTGRVYALTDAQGAFTYTPGAERLSSGESYTVELNVDAYFGSLGIVAGYKQIAILVRVINTEKDYRIGVLLTPFAHAAWSVR